MTHDPLLRDVPCAQRIVLPVLGLPTAFESNRASMIELVERTFGGWRTVDTIASADPLRVRIVVIDGVEPGPQPPAVRHIAPDASRIIIQSPGSLAISDPDRREVAAYVTTALVAEHELFRTSFLEAATLALLSHFDRHPVHAAAIGRDGRAVLLVGASGAGKSTLAHLAHSAGMDALSEDHVWIQLQPSRRVWGWPGYARLLGGGGTKTIVPLGGTDRAPCYRADSATVCVLDRGPRATLDRVRDIEIVAALTRDVAPGFDRFPERNAVVANALAAGGGWRLTLSDSPRDALPFLDEMLSRP